ncbi:MAG: hypothetical protein J0M08_00155 [Bacteroidetes bacterium]|nr:hypothetical protein [Bacteroidota bacterium]
MINFFRNNTPFATIIICVLGVLLWFSGFLNSTSIIVKHEMPLFETIAFSYNKASIAVSAFSLLLILGSSLLLNRLCNDYELLGRPNYVVGLIYLLICCSLPGLLKPNAFHFSNIIIVLGLQRLLSGYRQTSALSSVFDSSLLFGIATLFDFSSVTLVLFVWISIAIIRPFNWQEWVIPVIGFIIPYLFLGVYFFWIDRIDYLIYDKMLYNIIYEPFVLNFTSKEMPVIYTLLAILIFSLFNYFTGGVTPKLKSQKVLQVLLVLLFVNLIGVLFSREIGYEMLAQCAIPLSVFIGRYLYVIRRPFFSELFFFLLLAVIIVCKF